MTGAARDEPRESLAEIKAAVATKSTGMWSGRCRRSGNAYDIERLRRTADFVLAPVTVIERTIGVIATAKNGRESLPVSSARRARCGSRRICGGLAQLISAGERLARANGTSSDSDQAFPRRSIDGAVRR